MTNIERIVDFVKNGNKSSFCQSPENWLIKNGLVEYLYMVDGFDTQAIKKNFIQFVYGVPVCKCCGSSHNRLLGLGWKLGWCLTCSEECRQKLASERQMGINNTSHKMTKETRAAAKVKQSKKMKSLIMSGKFTPKTENYKCFGLIEFYHGTKIRGVRSLWEMIYWIQHPNLEYETIRIPYFDTIKNKERIYIVDFYDAATNTLYEVKPKKYQTDLKDKIIGVNKTKYNYVIIDDNYFDVCKTDALYQQLKNLCVDFKTIEKRLKWIKKAK